MKYRAAFVFAALSVATLSFSIDQDRGNGKDANDRQRPGQSQTKTRYKAYPIDTRSFASQIDGEFVYHERTAENPAELPDFGGVANKLPVGETFGATRATVGASFPGISATGWVPADPDIAVGKNHIIEVVNMRIAWFSKDGTVEFQQDAENFFAGMGAFNFQFDPKCFYDRVHERYVMLFLEKNTGAAVSKLLVAVSDDDDPNGTWYRYRIEAKLTVNSSSYWMDYPGFGYNKDAYVASGNMFGFSGGFAGVQFIVMESAGMLSGGAAVVTSLRHAGGVSVQVANVIDPDQNVVFAASRQGTSRARIYAIQNLTTTPTFSMQSVNVPSNNSPSGDANSTNGNFLDTIDARYFNVVWRAGRLFTGHTIEGTSNRAARWYEFDTGNWPASGSVTLVQSGNIQSASHHHIFPAITINSTGRISAIMTRSSTTTTADMVVSGRLPWDPAGTMSAPLLLESSTGNNYSRGRWGDYFGIDVDPVDDVTFWGVTMTVVPGGGSSDPWITQIRSWTILGKTDHAPTAFNWFRGVPQSGNLASLLSDDDNFNVAKAGIALSTAESPAQMTFDAVAPSSVVTEIEVTLISKTNTIGLSQKIELFNFNKNRWDTLTTGVSTTSESTMVATTTGNVFDPMSNYLEPGTNKVRAKASWYQTGIALLWPWSVSVDKVSFGITSA